MNLISCDNCGVVFNRDVLNFPDKDDLLMPDGSINVWKAAWDSQTSEFLPIVSCPVCYNDIFDRPPTFYIDKLPE